MIAFSAMITGWLEMDILVLAESRETEGVLGQLKYRINCQTHTVEAPLEHLNHLLNPSANL